MGGNVKVNNLSSEFRASRDGDNNLVADRSVAVGGTAVPLIDTPALNTATTHVNIDIQGDDVWYTLDGSDPVATTNGHKLPADTTAIWNIDLASTARFISEGTSRIHLSELQAK